MAWLSVQSTPGVHRPVAEVRAFRGIRYSPTVVPDISAVVCPPYDTITASEAEALRRRTPYNAVNLELTYLNPDYSPEDNRYARTADLFLEWLKNGVLVRDSLPGMYLVDEEFTFNGNERRRRGLMVTVRLEEFEKAVVLPHEHTTAGPIADRLALLEAAHCNFSPLMGLYRDSDGVARELLETAQRGAPLRGVYLAESYRCKVWSIVDPQVLSKIGEAMAARPIVVADGHHRYEAALRYRDETQQVSGGSLPPNSAARYVMMTLIAMDDPGVLLLPHHRLLGGIEEAEMACLRQALERAFRVDSIDVSNGSVEATARAIEERLAAHPADEVALAAFGFEPGKAHLLTMPESRGFRGDDAVLQRCDTWLLHQRVIGPVLGSDVERNAVSFLQDMVEAVRSVRSGDKQAAFLLRSLPMDLFEQIVRKGERLPPKSTCFYPKLPTGLVINTLEGDL